MTQTQAQTQKVFPDTVVDFFDAFQEYEDTQPEPHRRQFLPMEPGTRKALTRMMDVLRNFQYRLTPKSLN